jgi:DNA polymerase III delta prime subunit
MHAYLYQTSNDNYQQNTEIANLFVGKLILKYDLQTIADTQKLRQELKFTPSKPQVVVLNHLDQFSGEIVNALLKTLEEPNDQTTFLLLANNLNRIPPTISSRCALIKDGPTPVKKPVETTAPNLNNWHTLKKRDEALAFLNTLNLYYHSCLLTGRDLKKAATNLSLIDTTQKNLKANGNLFLNLVNLSLVLKQF